MAAALRSDKDLREALKSFFSLVAADAQPPGTVLDDVIFKTGGRFAHGIYYIESQESETARHKAIERLTKILGPVSSDEKENDEFLWKTAADRSQAIQSDSVDQAVEKVIGHFEKMAIEPQKFIGRNHVLQFTGSTVDLHIGPVRAVKMAILEAELQAAGRSDHWTKMLSLRTRKDSKYADQRIKLDLLWEVDLTASIKNTKEQAVWMVDVALGIIRLATVQQPLHHPSDIGEQEADPFLKNEIDIGVVLRKNGMNLVAGGGRILQINDAIYGTLTSKPFDDSAALFNAKKGSVGERVAQGLGWMTRGRQSPDRAERLLYFFTAIEALLTNDDKTAPVTQTIARHASVILADTPEQRAEIAGKIKTLYNARSALVHAGKRVVTRNDANMIQDVVEALYISIMMTVDLRSDFGKLNANLAKASYGGPWPERDCTTHSQDKLTKRTHIGQWD